MAGPLEGIRICDLTTLTAGGEATGFLCDLGAEVIKVEPPGGEVGRRLTPLPSGVSTFILPQNRGKRSIVIDLQKPGARSVVLTLARRCDVFAHNFRPGVIERLGLGYDEVFAVNQEIVYAASSGYGTAGPDAELTAVDLVGQARAGVISVTGEDNPVPMGAIFGDYVTAMHLAIGILAGLQARALTGKGQKVEGSILGSLINAQGWEMTHYLVTGKKPRRSGRGHQLFGPLWGVFATADGHVALASLAAGKVPDAAAVLEAPELEDERFRDPRWVVANQEELAGVVAGVFACRTSSQICSALNAIEVRCYTVQDYEAVASDPQVLANDHIIEIDHPKLGKSRMTGNPLRFSQTPIALAAAAPEPGENSHEILRWAGYADSEIGELRSRGLVQ